MVDPLAEVARAAGQAIEALQALSVQRATDSVTILDVIVTADAEDLVVEAVGADGESIVPVARISRDAPGDAARTALLNAIVRVVSRAIEPGAIP